MATQRQTQAARRTVRHAQAGARRRRSPANLPESTGRELGRQGARARGRSGRPGRSLEDRTREQIYAVARREGVAGRSKMAKRDLIDAIRRAR